jgi:hypothetical protein
MKGKNKMDMTTINSWLLQGQKEEQFLISDIAKHGCAGGTASFYDEHEDEIWTILSDEADAAGIANGLMLYNICKQPTSMRVLKNDLVWFAVQVAAQELVDNLEEELRDPVTQQEVPRC